MAFNRKRLTFARRRRGLTKRDFAKKLRVDVRTVIAWEAGEYRPSEDLLPVVSSALQFPEEFFFGETIDEPDPEIVSFRALTKMAAWQRDMAITQGGIAMLFSSWVEKRFELPPSMVPDLSYESSPEAAAQTVREAWSIGNLSVRNMVHLLEANGVRVFSLAVEAREVDAFSTWKAGTPFVFLNGFKTAEHSRFDAAHELGHLVLHKHGGPRGRQAEVEANAFASAFLMPSAMVAAYRPKFQTLDELIGLKKLWGVSVSALNYRLHQLGFMSDWHYKRLCIEISKRGFRTSEPEGLERETSQVWPKILSALYQDSGLTRAGVASEIGVSARELESLLFAFVLSGIDGGRKGGDIQLSTRSQLQRVK